MIRSIITNEKFKSSLVWLIYLILIKKTQLINFLDDCRIIILIKNIVKSSKDNLISKY